MRETVHQRRDSFALFHRFDYSCVFIGASALLVLSFIFAFPVGEPKRPLTERYTAERWIDNLMVRESLDPAIGVAFFSFGHAGILTFLPIHALKIGVGSLTLAALLDLVNQSFLVMHLTTAAVVLIGLWINWRRGSSY